MPDPLELLKRWMSRLKSEDPNGLSTAWLKGGSLYLQLNLDFAGALLRREEGVEPTPYAMNPERWFTCACCGNLVHREHVYCYRCGTRLKWPEATS